MLKGFKNGFGKCQAGITEFCEIFESCQTSLPITDLFRSKPSKNPLYSVQLGREGLGLWEGRVSSNHQTTNTFSFMPTPSITRAQLPKLPEQTQKPGCHSLCQGHRDPPPALPTCVCSATATALTGVSPSNALCVIINAHMYI